MIVLCTFTVLFLLWLAICWAVNVGAPPPPVDPCAEHRAQASALRAYYRSLADDKEVA